MIVDSLLFIIKESLYPFILGKGFNKIVLLYIVNASRAIQAMLH